MYYYQIPKFYEVEREREPVQSAETQRERESEKKKTFSFSNFLLSEMSHIAGLFKKKRFVNSNFAMQTSSECIIIVILKKVKRKKASDKGTNFELISAQILR